MIIALYHGTCAKNLDGIVANGLKVRAKNPSVYKEFPSAEDRIYLTNNLFALTFALNTSCEDEDEGLIVKVEVDTKQLIPDEDCLEQVLRDGKQFEKDGNYSCMADYTMLERTAFLKAHAIDWKEEWDVSLDNLGTVAHLGNISREQIIKCKTVNWREIYGVYSYENAITIQNYLQCGTRLKAEIEQFME